MLRGDFALTIAKGVELVYTERDRLCTLRFTDPAISGGRSCRTARLAAPCRSLLAVGDASSLELFINRGAAVFSTRYYPAPGRVSLQLGGTGGTVCTL